MRHCLDARDALDRANFVVIGRVLGEQGVSVRALAESGTPFRTVDQRASERVTVCVQADGGQTDDRVAGLDAAEPRKRFDLDDADDRTRQIEVPRLIKARHLGRLAAQKRTVVPPAGFRAAAHDLGRDLRIELADRKVI